MKTRRFLRSLCLLLSLVFTTTPALVTFAQDCPETRLEIGGRGRVTPGAPNRLRSAPSTSGEILGEIPAGSVFEVLDGPECADGFLWWNVDFDGLVGWTAEGSTDGYFAEPATLSYIGLPDAQAVSWSAQGDYIAVGTSDGVYLFDGQDFSAAPTLILEGSEVDDLAFNPYMEDHLAVKQIVNEKYSASVYSIDTGEKLFSLVSERTDGIVNSLTFDYDSRYVAVNHAGLIEVYDAATGGLRYAFQISPSSSPTVGTLSLDGTLLGASDGAAVVVVPVGGTHTDAVFFDRETIDAPVLAMAISPDSQNVVVGDAAGSLQMWNISTGAYTSFIRGERSTTSNRVNDLLFNPNNTVVYTAESDPHAVIRAFNAQTLATVNALDFGAGTSAAHALALSPDGTQLAVVVNDTVRIIDVETFTEIGRLSISLERGS